MLNEAGLSTQAFYRHFRSKSELIVTLGEQSQRVLANRLEAELAAATTAFDAVRVWVSAMLTLPFDDRTASCNNLIRDRWPALVASFPEVAERCQRLLLAPLERAVRRGCREGEFGVADPGDATLAIHELCTGVLYNAPVWARRGTCDDTIAFVMRAVEALLRIAPGRDASA